MHPTIRGASSLLVVVVLATTCASGAGGGGAYDPDARETLGKVITRKETGITTTQAGTSVLIPVGKLFVPIPLDRGSGPLPVLEYQVKLEDSRIVSIFSWYPHHAVGNCVKLFESPRSDYPRLINFHGCKE